MLKPVILGVGSFAQEVKWLISQINSVRGQYKVLGCVVSDLGTLGRAEPSVDPLGDYSWLEQNRSSVDGVVLGMGAPSSRLKVGLELSERFPDLDWPVLIHPSVMFDSESWSFAPGALVCASSVLTADITVGRFSMINLNCTIWHASKLGEGSVLSPGVNISGGVSIGDGALVGTGAQVLQCLSADKASTVGAGAVVTKDVDAGLTVVGVPARPLMKKG